MADNVHLSRAASQALVLTHSRAAAVRSFVATLFWLLLLSLAGYFSLPQVDDRSIWYLLLFLGLLFAGLMLRRLWQLVRVLRGLTYTFDPVNQIIQQGAVTVGRFDQVEKVEIYTTYQDGDTEGKDCYAVRLVFKDQKPLHLAQIQNRFELVYVADEIAKVLGVAVQGKPPGTFVPQTQLDPAGH